MVSDMTTSRPSITMLPWAVALVGLAVPLIGGGGAGWPYVVGWLVVLALAGLLRPLRLARRQDQIRWAVATTGLLVVPGFIVGGIYLVPAGLVWLVIAASGRPDSTAVS